MGRDWTQRGNKIRHNKFHDIYGFGLSGLGPDGDGVYQYEAPHQAWGIYLDDCSSGTTVFGNLFYRVPLCGVMIGGGRDNVVENNIFVDCVPALHIDDRWDEYCWDVMHERLQAMNPSEPPYSVAYPELLTMGDDPRKPENNRFIRNIVYYAPDAFRGLSTTADHPEKSVVYDFDQFDPASTVVDENLLYHEELPIRVAWSEYGKSDSGKTLSWQEWQEKGFDKRSVVKNPMFLDPDRDDYSLAPNSPAAEINFKPLPFHLMGLIDDEFRVSPIPPRDERRDGVKHQRFPVKVE
jgi:parallel beta-helix repeat protein